MASLRVPFYQVDAFAPAPLMGNPAAVLLLPFGARLDDVTLLRLAAENNLSETAFLQPLRGDPAETFEASSRFGLRWFTPTKEVSLCGHATLAAAAALFALGNANAELAFETLSGTLFAARTGGRISLDFPLNPPLPLPMERAEGELQPLLVALLEGHEGLVAGVASSCAYSAATKKLVVRLPDATLLPQLRPQASRLLAAHDGSAVTGVSVTAPGPSPEYDFSSRYFAPWNGIDEDPVNGSSHTVLAPFWSERLGAKTSLRAWQASARGGDLTLGLRASEGRVSLAGDAVVVIEGHMAIPWHE